MDAIIDGQQGLSSKPSPEPFLFTAQKLMVEPAACLVFEDSEAGILSGKAAGMCVIGVGKQAALAEPDFCFRTLENVEPAELYQCYQAWAQKPDIS